MAQGGHVAGTDGDHGAGTDAALADAPDERLTELLRSPTPTAYPALQELRRRHHPAVLAYARLCAASEAAARRLAAEALTTAVREAARGREPNAPLRHWLLLLTARLAAGWAADDRSAGLDPALLLVLNACGLPEGPTPPLLPAYLTLPSRAQGLIWYGALDAEPVERTAALLGLSRADVAHGTPPALKALAQACLAQRLAASDDPRCADFRRLIEEAVRQDGARHSADLDAHRVHCPYCTAAVEDLTALRDAPRQALAEGLLPWSGTSYLRAGDPLPAPAPRAADRPGRSPRRRYLLASTALALALVPVLVLLLTSSHGPDQRETAATPAPPPVTVTATVSLSPSPSPSPTPSPSRTSASPSPGTTSHRPAPPPPPRRTPRPSPTPSPPGGSFAQVVNVATGRCLDIRDGDLSEGNDVVTAGCDSSATQRWRVDADLGVLRSAADPRFCLDSRGSTYRGVGIWECDAVYGGNGQNLRFTVGPDGTVRPAIDTGTAVTPDGGDGVVLRPLDGGAAQRWRAGAA
ncbi:ricin-type beta-trefoil lectin domain protein [Streptomyces bungoensis]|uniref:Ricin-type beta-trefoil lectin domain protein n=1 Tax=Streptomyces bungoensis TaxID=285568 RepID=A0A124I4U7_9ACTN|nr:RICIN domain-containing protein [Streptomyces bungoensis]KUN87931.1 ricin-type beta-trefoil lectin domain protein [Streptomyces bungoensis]